MYFNVNFNVFFNLIKVHLLVSELYTHPVLFLSFLLQHILFKPVSGSQTFFGAADHILVAVGLEEQ